MKNKANKNLTSLDELLDKKYGKRGVKKREEWEQEFEALDQKQMTEAVSPILNKVWQFLSNPILFHLSYVIDKLYKIYFQKIYF